MAGVDLGSAYNLHVLVVLLATANVQNYVLTLCVCCSLLYVISTRRPLQLRLLLLKRESLQLEDHGPLLT